MLSIHISLRLLHWRERNQIEIDGPTNRTGTNITPDLVGIDILVIHRGLPFGRSIQCFTCNRIDAGTAPDTHRLPAVHGLHFEEAFLQIANPTRDNTMLFKRVHACSAIRCENAHAFSPTISSNFFCAYFARALAFRVSSILRHGPVRRNEFPG